MRPNFIFQRKHREISRQNDKQKQESKLNGFILKINN
jgi:hypothetical protein